MDADDKVVECPPKQTHTQSWCGVTSELDFFLNKINIIFVIL